MRECDTPRPVTFLEGGGPVGLRVSAVITGKPVGCGRRLGIGGEGGNVDVVIVVHWSLEGEGEPRA